MVNESSSSGRVFLFTPGVAEVSMYLSQSMQTTAIRSSGTPIAAYCRFQAMIARSMVSTVIILHPDLSRIANLSR